MPKWTPHERHPGVYEYLAKKASALAFAVLMMM